MDNDPSDYRRGFMFWSVTPFLLIFLIAMPFLVPEWTAIAIIVLATVELLCLLVLLCLLNPIRHWWTWRAVGATIFFGYLAYLVSMFVESSGEITIGKSKAEPSVFNAVLGLVAFGLPGLAYALFGRFTFWREGEIDKQHVGECEDEDTRPTYPGD